MQGPGIGAVATGPSSSGFPGGCVQTEQQPRQNHVYSCRLQALLPEQECTETMEITFYHLIGGMQFSEGERSNKTQICLGEEGRVLD